MINNWNEIERVSSGVTGAELADQSIFTQILALGYQFGIPSRPTAHRTQSRAT